jgi:hypothetical protein
MILTGRVVEIASSTSFVDKCQRVSIRVQDADSMFNLIRIKSIDGLFRLDEELAIEITPMFKGIDTFEDGSPVTEPPPEADPRHPESREGR